VIPDRFDVLAAVVALAFLGWVLLRLRRLTRRGQDQQAARLALRVGALWLVGLLLVTLGGRPQDANGSVFFNWVPFATQNAAHESEIVMNCLLFVPAGVLLPWIVRAGWRWLALVGAASLSAVIEIVQTFTPLGTAGDLTDILLNTLGAVLAAAVSSIAFRAWKLSGASVTKNHEIRSDLAGWDGR
jgi:glycopeptide antibiotics resistance protein